MTNSLNQDNNAAQGKHEKLTEELDSIEHEHKLRYTNSDSLSL